LRHAFARVRPRFCEHRGYVSLFNGLACEKSTRSEHISRFGKVECGWGEVGTFLRAFAASTAVVSKTERDGYYLKESRDVPRSPPPLQKGELSICESLIATSGLDPLFSVDR